ncbi:YlxQ family RNA-binding protein [Ammoniphilus sp. CFH 90114]|uniref:YlxQ family RNA-binding protein n=1 Tax=Ammoniphilus sp. CFH 90114 TaxID=2493665 RepID=UPI00100DCD41|nr:YlxQ family RNA-binding protein [Ammoniphilus sp. CFH 90114]RXT15155.1 YlxQ family RNA-binding protein [Ammoniphilus sp. CFH 90114]
MSHKVEQFLGLAQRAGKLITGEELVVKAIRAKQVHLVILSGDASDNTLKKVTDKCRTYDIPLRLFADRYRLGHYIGKEQRVVIGVKDYGFARELLKHMDQVEGGNV